MRVYLEGTMVVVENAAGTRVKVASPGTFYYETTGTNSLSLYNDNLGDPEKILFIEEYNFGDVNNNIQDIAGVALGTIALAESYINSFVGRSPAAGAVTLQTTAPIVGGSLVPLASYTLSFNINALPTLAAPNGNELVVVYDPDTLAHYKTTISPTAEYYEVFTPINGQTVFTLANTSLQPNLSQLFISTHKLIYVTDYNVAGTTLTVINPSYIINATDIVEFYYS